jgi:metallophosphoesterase (TIGR00282 family)
MKVLFLGDIVGKPGREAVTGHLPGLRTSMGIDLVVANAENAAGGSGCTTRIAQELLGAGVDAITLGDHVWDQRGFAAEIDQLERVCRPANLPTTCPGRTHLVVESGGLRLGVFTVLGRSFMKLDAACPFLCADQKLEALKSTCDCILVEVHAETTAEKIAFGWYLDGRATAVVGTHTHCPTADLRLLPRGTAYQTDAGMTGPHASVLGRSIGPIIGRYLDGMPRKWPVAEEDVRLQGVVLTVDPSAGQATACERFEYCVDTAQTAG